VRTIFPKVSLPIVLIDFLKDDHSLIKNFLWFNVNPPFIESFQDLSPLPPIGEDDSGVNYDATFKALTTKIVKMVTTYYTNNTFDLNDQTKECTAIAFRCSDDDTSNCCKGN
jgi:hypothetical protein